MVERHDFCLGPHPPDNYPWRITLGVRCEVDPDPWFGGPSAHSDYWWVVIAERGLRRSSEWEELEVHSLRVYPTQSEAWNAIAPEFPEGLASGLKEAVVAAWKELELRLLARRSDLQLNLFTVEPPSADQ